MKRDVTEFPVNEENKKIKQKSQREIFFTLEPNRKKLRNIQRRKITSETNGSRHLGK